MGKKPGYLSFIPLAAVQPRPPHTCLLHSPNLRISLARNMRAEGKIPSKTTHLRAHSLLNVQRSTSSSSSVTIPPSDGSKTPPSLTQPRSYLASRTPRNPHADTHRALFSAVCVSQIGGQFPLLTVFSRDWNIDEPRTRWLEMTWMG